MYSALSSLEEGLAQKKCTKSTHLEFNPLTCDRYHPGNQRNYYHFVFKKQQQKSTGLNKYAYLFAFDKQMVPAGVLHNLSSPGNQKQTFLTNKCESVHMDPFQLHCYTTSLSGMKRSKPQQTCCFCTFLCCMLNTHMRSSSAKHMNCHTILSATLLDHVCTMLKQLDQSWEVEDSIL